MASRTDGGGQSLDFYDGSTLFLAHPKHGATYLASEYLPGANGSITAINLISRSAELRDDHAPVARFGQRIDAIGDQTNGHDTQ